MLQGVNMRTLALWGAMLILVGCSDGAGCSGLEPIPDGFPLDRRIENGYQMRLTPDGVDFIEANLDDIIAAALGGSLLFEVPTSEVTGATICPDGGCYLSLEIVTVNLTPTSPDLIELRMNVHAFSANASGSAAPFPFTAAWVFDCTANIDTELSGASTLPVTGEIVFTVNTVTGYTEISFEELDATSSFEDDDIDIDGGVLMECEILDLLKGLFIGMMLDGINEMMGSALGEFTCSSCESPDDCPDDATCVDNLCMRGDECVAPLLGLEGRLAMGALLGSISPGLAQIDMVAAAGGRADVNPHGQGGISLGMYGGAEPVNLDACVPHDVPPPPRSPVAVSDTIDQATDCPSCDPSYAHLVMGVSETALTRMGWASHQSGGLCLGIGSGALPLTSGSLGLLINSLEDLTWNRDAPVALDLVPAHPPVFELGEGTDEDPLLVVTMNELSIDFYVWIHDRWSRFMQVTSDVTIDLDLEAIGGEIQISVGSLVLANTSVTGNDLITEEPADIEASLEGLIGMIAGPLLGNVGSFALPEFSGFSLNIPDGGIVHIDEGSEEFLAIYSSLAVAPTTSHIPEALPPIRTQAEIIEVVLPPTEEFAAPPTIPSLRVSLDALGAGDQSVEFRTKLNSGFWSSWTTDRIITIQDGILSLQGRHRLSVQARLYHRPETTDRSPLELEVLIDTIAPEVSLRSSEEMLEVEVWDMVSPAAMVDLEWRLEGSDLWQEVEHGQLSPSEGETIEVRATDEAGNVSVSRHALRGRVTETGDGCGGCATTKGRSHGLPLGLAFLAALLFLTRRRSVGSAIAILASVGMTACSDPVQEGDSAPPPQCETDDDCTGGRCCLTTNECIDFTPEQDSCDEDNSCTIVPPLNADCQYEPCDSCDDREHLPVGYVGLYSSIAVADSETWIAGYAAGTRPGHPYGDLVVAHVAEGAAQVSEDSWVAIDGVPAGVEAIGNVHGFRAGIDEPGEDVGLYTSVAINDVGSVGIAYYDVTHGSLKYATQSGDGWGVPVIVDGIPSEVDAGRFADLIFLPGDIPAIVYMFTELEDDGRVVTRARYAQATNAGGASWAAPVDLDVLDPTPCTAAVCETADLVCDLVTNRCETPANTCSDDCAEGLICVRGECHEWDSGPTGLPEGTGLWPDIALGPDGTRGVVFYDRTAGNLVGVAFNGNSWEGPQVFAGEGGDVGWTPSIAIDSAGVWHMTAVDGLAEDLLYIRPGGVVEVIDGRSLGGHYNLRGDDSSIVLLPGGDVRVVYQDVTELQLWVADRESAGHWLTTQLEGQGLGATAAQGYYVSQSPTLASSVVSAWYLDPQNGDTNGVTLFWL